MGWCGGGGRARDGEMNWQSVGGWIQELHLVVCLKSLWTVNSSPILCLETQFLVQNCCPIESKAEVKYESVSESSSVNRIKK